jgi:hypothetical protein
MKTTNQTVEVSLKLTHVQAEQVSKVGRSKGLQFTDAVNDCFILGLQKNLDEVTRNYWIDG